MKIENHHISYNQDQNWQYFIGKDKLKSDLKRLNLSKKDMKKLNVSDFEFKFIAKKDVAKKAINTSEIKKMNDFIMTYEWMISIPQRSTHYFGAYYKNELAGVLIFATPNTFDTKIWGEENKNKVKLLARGATSGWTPKNLGSSFISYATNYLVKNTEFRIFYGYSDMGVKYPNGDVQSCGEKGVIYQACNWLYLGQNFGGKIQYIDPTRQHKLDGKYTLSGNDEYYHKPFADRELRKVSFYKKFAQDLSIEWLKEWGASGRINREIIPTEVFQALKDREKEFAKTLIKLKPLKKRKWCFFKGRTKKETKKMKKLFLKNNPKMNCFTKCGRLIGYSYPKD